MYKFSVNQLRRQINIKLVCSVTTGGCVECRVQRRYILFPVSLLHVWYAAKLNLGMSLARERPGNETSWGETWE